MCQKKTKIAIQKCDMLHTNAIILNITNIIIRICCIHAQHMIKLN